MLKGCKENGLMDRGQNYCIITKVQVKRRVRKSRVEVVMEWVVNTPEYRLLSGVFELLSLDQVQCTHLWPFSVINERSTVLQSSFWLVLYWKESWVFILRRERFWYVRAGASAVSRSFILEWDLTKDCERTLSKHKLFDTLIELLTQDWSSPPWCRDNDYVWEGDAV